MRERDILHRVHADRETDSKDILVALIASDIDRVTKHDVARLGKMSLKCAHSHLSHLTNRGYFTRVPRTAANGAHMPTIYRLTPERMRRWTLKRRRTSSWAGPRIVAG